MHCSAMSFMGAAATSIALMGCNAANAQPSTATLYPSASASADIYSPAPPASYAPQMTTPSSSSRVTGRVDVNESCSSLDCLPSYDDRWKAFSVMIGLALFIGLGALYLISQHDKNQG